MTIEEIAAKVSKGILGDVDTMNIMRSEAPGVDWVAAEEGVTAELQHAGMPTSGSEYLEGLRIVYETVAPHLPAGSHPPAALT